MARLFKFFFGIIPAAAAFMKGVCQIHDLPYARSKGANAVKTYDEYQLSQVTCELGLDIFATVPVYPQDDPTLASKKGVDFVNRWKHVACIKHWAIGNELDQRGDANQMMQLAASVSRAIKEVDTRPRSTCLAGYDRLAAYLQVAKDFDVMCINCYKCAEDTCSKVAASGYTGNFILGEYGVHGWWEQPTFAGTSMPLEPSSSEKSEQTAAGFKGGVTECAGTSVTVVGHFAFTNERKIEGTHTWFGLWAKTPGVESGSPQPLSDRWAILSLIWSGSAPDPTAVRGLLTGSAHGVVQSIHVDNEGRVGLGAQFGASATLEDAGVADAYTAYWEIRADITPGSTGVGSGAVGGESAEQSVLASSITEAGSMRGAAFSTQLNAPSQPGAYRLTVFLKSSKGVVTASAPLIVH